MPTWNDPTRTIPGKEGFEYEADNNKRTQDRIEKLEQQMSLLYSTRAVTDLQTTSLMLADRVTVRSDITTPTDANFIRPIDGLMVYTTGNKRLWIRALGLWGYVTFT